MSQIQYTKSEQTERKYSMNDVYTALKYLNPTGSIPYIRHYGELLTLEELNLIVSRYN